jgi:DEAD/DEAH box helicase domain-containing protein
MELASLLTEWRLDQRFSASVAAWERIPARPARYADPPSALDRRLIEMLNRLHCLPLYSHQAQAVEAALKGQNVVLVTGTASGKSLAYQLLALQFALQDPKSSSLYLFPTKALAQDQATALTRLISALDMTPPVTVRVYDGDTPQSRRSKMRHAGGIVISNPDMLHFGILPTHSRWADFFQNLRLVVLDELHTYRGIFGSHVANVIRRLRRICRFYGSNPIFVCASATIANPAELAEKLIEAPIVLVEQDGAPHGEKHIVLYNPPLLDAKLGIRRSYILEAADIAARLIASGIQTAVFARARLTTEVLLGYVRDRVEAVGMDASGVRGYRGGYLPLERREIEQGLRSGEVRGVVATNALELGVDIGALGAAVLAGYPGTLASTWQQFGRAGRRADVSVGVLVASATPLDQYIVTHPAYLFERPPEHALINPDNLVILFNHLRCAAYELPFEAGESFGTFDNVDMPLALLAETGEVYSSGGMHRWVSNKFPAGEIGLRTGSSEVVVIQDVSKGTPEVIGQIDRQSAPLMVYEGAVYLHEGRQFLIESLDWEGSLAQARGTEADYYTDATSVSTVQVQGIFESGRSGNCFKATGSVQVTHQVTGYRIIKRYTHETLGYGEVVLPPQQFETTAYWVYPTPDQLARLEAASILLRPNDYGPNWTTQRNRARARDGYQCTRCGAPEQPNQQHDVHHLRPFREFGYIAGQNEAYIEANSLDNLVTLCRSCHRAVETARGTRSALSGLANVLHNLAPLYLMCSPGDIGVAVEQRSTYTQAPTITLYDHASGGMGLAVRLYDLHDEVFASALELVSGCACAEGCPACVGPVGEVGLDTKQLTITLLKALIGDSDAG